MAATCEGCGRDVHPGNVCQTRCDAPTPALNGQAPFAPGAYVTSSYRVEPFHGDEVLVVEECRNVGTERRPRWRVLCVAANRAVRGWLDADTLADAECHAGSVAAAEAQR